MMNWFTILLVAIGLAMDAFAVSVGVGTTGRALTFRSVFRLSFHLGLFQGGMTFLGWLAGSNIVRWIEKFDHWMAMALLAFVGLRMIRSGLNSGHEVQQNDLSSGGNLVLVSIATSIDALAVGLGMAMLKVNVLDASLVIGIVTLVLSLVGVGAGGLLGVRFGKRMEVVGGLILLGIGLRILVTHLAG